MYDKRRSNYKKIRENKGFSQSYVSKGLLTQGNYSKFEKSIIDIRSTTFIKILDRLEMSMEELLFIANNYSYSDRDSIIHKFYTLTYNDNLLLREFINEIENYLISNEDLFISNIKKVCISLAVLMETNNLEQARREAEEIWITLSKRDHLYISDVYLINSILFLFPIETSREIKNFLYRSLNNYKDFQKIGKMKINFSLNFSILLIRNSQYTEALQEINSVINTSKEYSDYLSIAICNIRKGICLNNIEQSLSSGSLYINKGLNLLEAMEEKEIFDIFKEEIERYNYK